LARRLVNAHATNSENALTDLAFFRIPDIDGSAVQIRRSREENVFMSSAVQSVQRLYPEVQAGGFSRVDGTVEFYQRINALLSPDMTVLDFGAGRGEQLLREDSPYRTALCKLQGKVKRIVGVDLDSAVLTNPFLDEAHLFEPGNPLPLGDGSFDLVYADWVIEHVADPASFVGEISRVLKPGGWFCARTPNRWGITGIATNLIPNRAHVRLLSRLQPGRQTIDVFPTQYRMNTLSHIRRWFKRAEWDDYSYIVNSEPPYVQGSILMMRLMQFYWRVTPSMLHTNIHVFVRRKPLAPASLSTSQS
jgi:SAM-dependent methyltransferase